VKIKEGFSKTIQVFVKIFGLREFLMVSGLSLLGYGLYLYQPWVSFTACGLLLIAGGFFIKDN
jgi:hypothetical protein